MADESRMVVHAYVRAVNRGDFDALRGLFSPHAEIDGSWEAGSVDRSLAIWRAQFEGWGRRLAVREMTGSGGVVAVRFAESGAFIKPTFGREPTGRRYEITAVEWFEIADGLISRTWSVRDVDSRARQLGIPPDAALDGACASDQIEPPPDAAEAIGRALGAYPALIGPTEMWWQVLDALRPPSDGSLVDRLEGLPAEVGQRLRECYRSMPPLCYYRRIWSAERGDERAQLCAKIIAWCEGGADEP